MIRELLRKTIRFENQLRENYDHVDMHICIVLNRPKEEYNIVGAYLKSFNKLLVKAKSQGKFSANTHIFQLPHFSDMYFLLMSFT